MSYVLGSGFHKWTDKDDEFAKIWYLNHREHAPFPARIAVITTGNDYPVRSAEIDVYRGENVGHIGGGEGRGLQLKGWSAGVITLCLLAYNSRADLIYREQDCLCFGPWVEKMYEDLGEADMIFGKAHEGMPHMGCSQSLFLIKNSFLLTFVRRYLALENDSLAMLPEHKFVILEEQEPDRFRRLSFGVDRERPLPWDAPVWYAQHWTESELKDAKCKNLIS